MRQARVFELMVFSSGQGPIRFRCEDREGLRAKAVLHSQADGSRLLFCAAPMGTKGTDPGGFTMHRARSLVSLVLAGFALASSAHGGGWQGLTNLPNFDPSSVSLLRDGRVLVNASWSVHW